MAMENTSFAVNAKRRKNLDTRGDQKVLQLDILPFMYQSKFCVIVMYDSYVVF